MSGKPVVGVSDWTLAESTLSMFGCRCGGGGGGFCGHGGVCGGGDGGDGGGALQVSCRGLTIESPTRNACSTFGGVRVLVLECRKPVG